jgi:hypothetical protein
LDPFDAGRNTETQKQTVEMGFNGAARHIELTGDFFVVATL